MRRGDKMNVPGGQMSCAELRGPAQAVTAGMQQGAGHGLAPYREGRRRQGFNALAEAAPGIQLKAQN